MREIDDLINQGYLMRKISDDGKLILYNYTNKCLYDKIWNEITINSRGHVYEVSTNKLIALPFSKFFNLNEIPLEEQKELLELKWYSITEKIDGSLGIIYNYDHKWRVNTRGSFDSEQSQEATRILNKNYDLSLVPTYFTILVEIVYPENQIVVNYGQDRKLVLLSMFNRETKVEVSREELETWSELTKIPIVKEFILTFDEMFEWQENHKELDKEGFVVKFLVDNKRIKIKSKRYFEVARLLANLTYKHLWENMEHGKVKREVIELIPEEFREELNGMVKFIEEQYRYIMNDISLEYYDLMRSEPTRKEIGLNNTLKHKGAMFSLLDKKTDKLENYIMKRIYENLPKLNKREELEA